MTSVRQLFLAAIVLMPLHIVEQLLFGIDELYELRDMVGAVLGWSGNPDYAIVVMTGLVVTLVLAFCYAFMAGGLPRLLAAGFFGVEFMGESHHLIKTLVRGEYFPGAVTALAIVVLGALILARAIREHLVATPAFG